MHQTVRPVPKYFGLNMRIATPLVYPYRGDKALHMQNI